MPKGRIVDKKLCEGCGLENTCYCIDCDNIVWSNEGSLGSGKGEGEQK